MVLLCLSISRHKISQAVIKRRMWIFFWTTLSNDNFATKNLRFCYRKISNLKVISCTIIMYLYRMSPFINTYIMERCHGYVMNYELTPVRQINRSGWIISCNLDSINLLCIVWCEVELVGGFIDHNYMKCVREWMICEGTWKGRESYWITLSLR